MLAIICHFKAISWSCWLFCGATILVAAPIFWMLFFGVGRRRSAVMDRLSADAKVLYHRVYCSTAVSKPGSSLERNTLRSMLEAARTDQTPESLSSPKLTPIQQSAQTYLDTLYDREYGKRAYLPALIAFVAIWFVGGFAVKEWLHRVITECYLPVNSASVAAAGFIGGLTWAASNLIARAWNQSLFPRDVMQSAFRLAIAAPMALGITFLLDFSKGQRDSRIILGIAYLLGTFPTDSLFTIGQTLLRPWIQVPGVPDQAVSELQKLPSIDAYAAERLRQVGITCPEMLATCDPVSTCWATGLTFDYIVICVLDALAWSYLGEARKFAAATNCGLRGAHDFFNLQLDLENTEKEQDRKDADQVVKELGGLIGSSEAVVRTMVWNIALDPQVIFLTQVWWDLDGVEDKPQPTKPT